MKKAIAILLIFCLTVCLFPPAYASEDTVVYDAADVDAFNRSCDEIVARYNQAFAAGGSYSDGDSSSYYLRMASTTAPYDQGELKQDTLDAMVAMTSFTRWLAGVPELQSGAQNNDPMQRAALIRNFDFNHYVDDSNKPADMDDEFWNSGKVSHNILALGYTPRGAINGWCNEGYRLSTQSWDTVGHRYCLIDSDVSALIFGFAGRVAIGKMTGYANSMQTPFAAFPAPGYMPTELINVDRSCWSLEPNYSIFSVDASALCVTVTDLGSGSSYDCTIENGLMKYDTWSSEIDFVQPQPATYPDSYRYPDGSSYRVCITGLTDRASGNPAEIRYTVNFFSMQESMATTVTSYALDFGNKLYLPTGLRSTEALNMLAKALPGTVNAETANGRSVPVQISGGWTYDEAEQCWKAAADLSSLPSNVTDPSGILNDLRIARSDNYSYTGSFSMTNVAFQQPGRIQVTRYMLSTPIVRVYQIKPDGSCVLRYTEQSDNFTDSDSYVLFSVDAWTPEDSGTWFAIYGLDWLGGFAVGTQEVTVACDHGQTRTDRQEPSCTEDGWENCICDICGQLLWHHVLPALGHDYQVTVVPPTCTEGGYTDHVCSRCGDSFRDGVLAPLGHDYQVTVVPPTCTEGGYTDHVCSRCGDSFRDGVLAPLGHDYQVTVVPPTCTEGGYTEHLCSRCGDSWRDALSDPLGHAWGEPVYTWSEDYQQVTAEAVCARDPSHKLTETVQTTAYSEDAGCTEPGTVTFTAVFENPLFQTQSVTVAGTPMGHDWQEPTFTWSEGNAFCTAQRVCRRDPLHTQTETVQSSSELTRPATYTQEGEITYTAQFQNPAFGTQTKTVAIPKLERPANPFIDVHENDYFYDPVLWAYYHNPQITDGTSENTFSPNATCTREQVVTFLWRASGKQTPASNVNPFRDVPADSWYILPVLWAASHDPLITDGLDEGIFGVGKPCTRAQVVTFLWRAAGEPQPTLTSHPFRDVEAGSWYEKAVLWAVENGITDGTSDTTFEPNKTCTRGQIVTFLYRAASAPH